MPPRDGQPKMIDPERLRSVIHTLHELHCPASDIKEVLEIIRKSVPTPKRLEELVEIVAGSFNHLVANKEYVRRLFSMTAMRMAREQRLNHGQTGMPYTGPMGYELYPIMNEVVQFLWEVEASNKRRKDLDLDRMNVSNYSTQGPEPDVNIAPHWQRLSAGLMMQQAWETQITTVGIWHKLGEQAGVGPRFDSPTLHDRTVGLVYCVCEESKNWQDKYGACLTYLSGMGFYGMARGTVPAGHPQGFSKSDLTLNPQCCTCASMLACVHGRVKFPARPSWCANARCRHSCCTECLVSNVPGWGELRVCWHCLERAACAAAPQKDH